MTREEYLFECLKTRISTAYTWSLLVSSFLDYFWGENVKIKFLLASLKSLIISKSPSRNPFQRACYSIQKAAYYSKNCPETAWDSNSCTLEKKDQWERRKTETEILMRLVRTLYSTLSSLLETLATFRYHGHFLVILITLRPLGTEPFKQCAHCQ